MADRLDELERRVEALERAEALGATRTPASAQERPQARQRPAVGSWEPLDPDDPMAGLGWFPGDGTGAQLEVRDGMLHGVGATPIPLPTQAELECATCGWCGNGPPTELVYVPEAGGWMHTGECLTEAHKAAQRHGW